MKEYIKKLLKDSVQGMAIAWHIINNDEFLVWTIEIEPQMWCDESIGYYVRATAIIGHITLPTVPTLNVWDIATSKAYSAKTFDDAIALVREFKEELAQITLPDITAQADTMVYIADLKWLNKMWQNWQDVIELTKRKLSMSKTQTHSILGNTLIMEPDGTGDEIGTVIVNGIEYHVIKDERWKVSINHKKVAEDYGYFSANVAAHIIKHQKMTAWQQTGCGYEIFKTIKDCSVEYSACDVAFSVYRADDATCWRYYTHDDTYACHHESPWYPANIQPSADHFTQWVISSIEVKQL